MRPHMCFEISSLREFLKTFFEWAVEDSWFLFWPLDLLDNYEAKMSGLIYSR